MLSFFCFVFNLLSVTLRVHAVMLGNKIQKLKPLSFFFLLLTIMWKGAGTISYSTEGRSGILTDLEIFQLTVTGMLCVHILPKLFTGTCERLGHKI